MDTLFYLHSCIRHAENRQTCVEIDSETFYKMNGCMNEYYQQYNIASDCFETYSTDLFD